MAWIAAGIESWRNAVVLEKTSTLKAGSPGAAAPGRTPANAASKAATNTARTRPDLRMTATLVPRIDPTYPRDVEIDANDGESMECCLPRSGALDGASSGGHAARWDQQVEWNRPPTGVVPTREL
ncbi:hypothetical protein GCM10010170_016660 [Dactylosporangium salmoneum]|uniref:Uncharacterized protein n=1 Tax=Dactylosporangium salmoneum TaxID=53361 RepID=A0ABP5SQ51_9ACTN